MKKYKIPKLGGILRFFGISSFLKGLSKHFEGLLMRFLKGLQSIWGPSKAFEGLSKQQSCFFKIWVFIIFLKYRIQNTKYHSFWKNTKIPNTKSWAGKLKNQNTSESYNILTLCHNSNALLTKNPERFSYIQIIRNTFLWWHNSKHYALEQPIPIF